MYGLDCLSIAVNWRPTLLKVKRKKKYLSDNLIGDWSIGGVDFFLTFEIQYVSLAHFI